MIATIPHARQVYATVVFVLGTYPKRAGSLRAMAAYGASSPLLRVPAKVPSLNPQPALSLGGGNASS